MYIIKHIYSLLIRSIQFEYWLNIHKKISLNLDVENSNNSMNSKIYCIKIINIFQYYQLIPSFKLYSKRLL